MKDYEKMVMEQVYDILMEDDFKWSVDFNQKMKMDLLNLLIEYFKNIEDYIKCSKLKPIIENLESSDDEYSNKGIETGSKKS